MVAHYRVSGHCLSFVLCEEKSISPFLKPRRLRILKHAAVGQKPHRLPIT
jgi:hypothetical protein